MAFDGASNAWIVSIFVDVDLKKIIKANENY